MIRKVLAFALVLSVLPASAFFTEPKGDPYLFSVCPVSDEKLGEGDMGDPVAFDHEGRDIRFCCDSCVKKFQKEPAKYLAKIDEAVVRSQLRHYPLDVCAVSGKKLGEMGEPVNHVDRNRLVRFCCDGCVKQFEKKPEEFLAKLDQAVIQKQKPSYAFDTCLVSGEKLGKMGEPVDFVAGNRLIRFCCKECVGKFRKEPWKYMAKLR